MQPGHVKALVLAGVLLVLAVPSASAGRLPILASQDWWPVYSPNGGRIAFTRVSGRTMTLEVVDPRTHRTFRLAENQGQLAPSWSSDGRLAFSLGGKIYTANANGSGRRPFTSQGHAYAPAWRPSSSDIAYLTTVGAHSTDLWVDGTLWARDVIGNPAWSHDGTQLAFQRDDGIYVTTGPGAEQRVALVASPFAPAWSPDGTLIAYQAKKRIWVVPADGSARPRALSAQFSVLSTPSWSADGTELTYTGSVSLWVTTLKDLTTRLHASTGAGVAASPTTPTIAFTGHRPGCPGHGAILLYTVGRVSAATGSCEVLGTPGNDVIDGTGAGGDAILAGAGNDAVHARNGHRDTVFCGPGRDTVWADRSDRLHNCETVHLP